MSRSSRTGVSAPRQRKGLTRKRVSWRCDLRAPLHEAFARMAEREDKSMVELLEEMIQARELSGRTPQR